MNNATVSKLIVDFNDDVPNDVAILTRKQRMYMSKEDEDNHNGCILSGHLHDEPLAAVTVSGCPGSGTFQVIPFLRVKHLKISFCSFISIIKLLITNSM